MLPTFSVNIDIFKKDTLKKVSEIMKSLNNSSYKDDVSREWVGEAFLKAVENENTDKINLASYAQTCNRNSKLNKMSKPETSIINQDEFNSGFTGVTDIVAEYVEDNIDDIIANLDMNYYIDSFLDTREFLYFKKGQDIWRLIQLAKLDDKQAQNKLRLLMDEFGLRELLYYILTKSACYSKLEGILC